MESVFISRRVSVFKFGSDSTFLLLYDDIDPSYSTLIREMTVRFDTIA